MPTKTDVKKKKKNLQIFLVLQGLSIENSAIAVLVKTLEVSTFCTIISVGVDTV